MNNRKLVIVGAGEFAEIAYEYFTYDSDYSVSAFSVEKAYMKEETLCGLPVIPFEEIYEIFPSDDHEVFVAIPASDMNQTRARLFLESRNMGYKLASYISSKAFVWRNVIIGENCFIFENNTVQPFVVVGDNVVLWSGNHIGHRTVIEANVFISSHVVVSGYCMIGENSFLGVNSTLNDNISVAKFSVIASGSLVNRNLVEENKIYIGSPVKSIPGKEAKSLKL
ncbi:acetyltransferase [Gammaproteobacteria bacterium]|nr:acetyltransferase [Gammaproteobacteria bacterium]